MTGSAVVVLTVLGLGYLAESTREHDGPSRLDPALAHDLVADRTPTLTLFAHLLTAVGGEVVVGALALLLAGLLAWQRRWVQALTVSAAIGGSAFLTVALKLAVARSRPGSGIRLGPVDHSYSFPSGHSLNSAVLLALLVWLLWAGSSAGRRVLLVLVATTLALGVGASRVYLGYHWATDVLASWLVAAGWLCLVALLAGPVYRWVSGQVTTRVCSRPGPTPTAQNGVPEISSRART